MILVDKRIGSKFTTTNGRPFDIFGALKERTNGNAQLCTLDSGDFAFEGEGPSGPIDIGIERKALGDFLTSSRKGRYAGGQAKRMSGAFGISYLIVEGLYRPSESGTLETFKGKAGWKPFTLAAKGPQSGQFWRYSELDKHVVSMEAKKNVIMVRSGSPMETVWQIVNRYQWWQKDWDSHQSCDPIKMQTEVFSEVTLIRAMISQVQGDVGWIKSKWVQEKFGSIIEMANALSSEWRAAGFSEAAAVRLYGLMRRDWRK